MIDAPFWSLVGDAIAGALNWDGRVVRTLRALLFAPGKLSAEWSAGRRAPYVTPVRLFLAMGIVFVAVLGLLGDAAFDVKANPVAESPQSAASEAADVGAWSAVEERLQRGLRRAERERQWIAGRVLANYVWAILLATPIIAAVVALLERKRRRRFVHHLVFAVHIHAASFVALAVMALAGSDATPPAVASVMAVSLPAYWLFYVFTAFRRAYGTRPLPGIVKTLVFAGAQMIVLSVATMVMVVATLILVA